MSELPIVTGDPEFEAWWKRYWIMGTFHEGPRKELALAAWNEAMRISKTFPPADWTDPAPKDKPT